jgi:ribonuclease HII
LADFLFEKHYLEQGCTLIAGVDEAGRGALFGPVVCSSVILPISFMRGRGPQEIEEIDDSKALSPRKRERLARFILSEALSVGIGISCNEEIDRDNIYWACLKAMKRAVQRLSALPDVVLVDGYFLKDIGCACVRIPQGDRRSTSIAAASIVAKVLRDKMMVLLDNLYRGYALGKNKGYGTDEHYRALKKMGPTPFHRFSFHLG